VNSCTRTCAPTTFPTRPPGVPVTTDNENDFFESAEHSLGLTQRLKDTAARFQTIFADYGYELAVAADTGSVHLDKSGFLAHELRHREAAVLQIKILFLAGQIILTQVLRDSEEPPPDEAEELRMSIIQDLWLDGQWVEPWITILEQELPGAAPSAADIERFIEAAAAKATASAENSAYFHDLRLAIHEILRAGCYPMEPLDRYETDHMLVIQLATEALFPGDIDVRRAYEARQLIKQTATDPEHPAWQVVIETYFTS
jgi:hypothetical protein